MSQDLLTGGTNVVVEGDNEDRISALPGNVIDHILGLLPAQDAAKTSILSKNWRYIWCKLPYLVLDYHFLNTLSERSQSFFRQTVDSILSLHLGDIVKFDLDILQQEGSSYEDVDTFYEDQDTLYEHVDRWMYQVTRNGIKELTIFVPQLEGGNMYEVPSCVFNCTTLTRLDLCNCVFKPPNSSLDFPKLETLYLGKVSFKLSTYTAPTLEKLNLTSPVLELLNAGTIPTRPLLTLDCVRDISSLVDFSKFSQTSGLLRLITSVPNLSKLVISVESTSESANAVEKYKRYLSSPACLDPSINKLEHAVIRWFRGSVIELLFVNLLLARTPSLVKMSIDDVRFEGERSIPGELISCPKASPNAELYFIQDGGSLS